MIPSEQIEEIIASTDIVDLVSQYVTLKKSGKNYKGLCPFHHEKTPSFVVSPEKGIFKCFGCGEGGGPIQFLMKIEGISFTESVKMLAERAGIVLKTGGKSKQDTLRQVLMKIMSYAASFYHSLLTKNPLGKVAMDYLLSRGLDAKTIESFKLGYAPYGGDFLIRHLRGKNVKYEWMERSGLVRRGERNYYDYFRDRIIFPIFNTTGKVVAMAGRVLGDKKGVPKYINTPESPIFTKGKILYGLSVAKGKIREEDEAYVVEGYMDAIALYSFGIENVVASMGTSLTQDQARLLARYTKNVVFAYDSDTAGRSATARGLEIFEKAGIFVKVMEFPKGEDPDSFIRKRGLSNFLHLKEKALGIIEYRVDMLKRKYDLSTPEGKEKFVDELVPILREIQGDIKRFEYIRIISEENNLPEEILRRKVVRRRRKGGNLDLTYAISGQKTKPEERLIHFLLSSPKYIPICRKYNIRDVFDEKLYPIYEKLLNSSLEGEDVVGVEILSRLFSEEDLFKKAIDLSMLKGLPPCSEEEIQNLLEYFVKKVQVKQDKEDEKYVLENLGKLDPNDPIYIRWLERRRLLKSKRED